MKARQNQFMKYDEMYYYESGMVMRRRTLREATNCLYIDILTPINCSMSSKSVNKRSITRDHLDRSSPSPTAVVMPFDQ